MVWRSVSQRAYISLSSVAKVNHMHQNINLEPQTSNIKTEVRSRVQKHIHKPPECLVGEQPTDRPDCNQTRIAVRA